MSIYFNNTGILSVSFNFHVPIAFSIFTQSLYMLICICVFMFVSASTYNSIVAQVDIPYIEILIQCIMFYAILSFVNIPCTFIK